MAAFGARLGASRRAAGLSQQELAEQSGLSIRAISNLERGRARWPHPDTVRRLADALGLRGEPRKEFVATAGRRLSYVASGRSLPGHQPQWARGRQAVPRQLPASVTQFAGRERELAALSRLLERAGSAAAVVISAIGGTAGVGKTALAVHWAHHVAEQFPDGQLYVNLRGYDPSQPVPASEALAGFLRTLGMAGEDIPGDADERAAAYRSLLAERRMLVVLDNAREVGQVRPLLPGSPTCVTVVTSRDAMAGLVARDGAIRLEVNLLQLPEAIGLLRGLIGSRADDDPAATVALARQCCLLPLALRVAAERALASPNAPLADLVTELADRQHRLDALESGGDDRTAVRSVFAWSYEHLDRGAARLFRLLGLHPGLDLDLYAAAALADSPVGQTRGVLEMLARAHLIRPASPSRYTWHDLLRAYASELAHSEDSEDQRQAALTRMLDHYLSTAACAMDTLFPAERGRRPSPPPPATASPPLADAARAKAWLDAELANLVASAAASAYHQRPAHATRLSATLSRYLAGRGHFPEAVVIHNSALAAARVIGDRAAEATTLSNLSQIDLHYGHSQQAASQLQQALALFRAAGDQAGQARVLHNLATVEGQQGLYQQARGHHQQALALHLAAGNQTGAARALHGLGDVDLRMGHYQRADDNLQRALALCRETGDRLNEAFVVALLGDLSLRRGRYRDAAGGLERALSLFREAGDRTGEAWALAHLGTAQQGQGRGQLAIDYYHQARAMARDNKDLFGEAEAVNGLGEALLAASQPDAARTAHLRALELAGETGDRIEQARAHAGLARSHQDPGDLTRALDHWHKALALYDDLGTPEARQIRAQLAAASDGPREESAAPPRN